MSVPNERMEESHRSLTTVPERFRSSILSTGKLRRTQSVISDSFTIKSSLISPG